jgi:hypothetical protein
MAKTYIPGWLDKLNKTSKYGTRWQTKLEAGMTPEQLACFQAVLQAVASCLLVIPKPPPNP